MDISIIGAGVVGRATGFGLESKGHSVMFSDTNEDALARLREGGHNESGSVEDATRVSNIIMVCVPTPTTSSRFVLSHVLDACTQIGRSLKDASAYKIVVIRSTVIPFSTRNAVIPILEKESQKKAGPDFGVCVNPEFLRDATPLEDFILPDRILIDELDQRSGQALERVYENFGKMILHCSLEEAELAKYLANGFLATKISYFNEAYKLCRRLGTNPEMVSLAVSMDRRIGPYGTVGGKPFDGKCLPKDTEAFLSFVADLGERLEVLSAADRVNKQEQVLTKLLKLP